MVVVVRVAVVGRLVVMVEVLVVLVMLVMGPGRMLCIVLLVLRTSGRQVAGRGGSARGGCGLLLLLLLLLLLQEALMVLEEWMLGPKLLGTGRPHRMLGPEACGRCGCGRCCRRRSRLVALRAGARRASRLAGAGPRERTRDGAGELGPGAGGAGGRLGPGGRGQELLALVAGGQGGGRGRESFVIQHVAVWCLLLW